MNVASPHQRILQMSRHDLDVVGIESNQLEKVHNNPAFALNVAGS
jgi:hypothetical protein